MAATFRAYPAGVRRRLLELRELVFDTAARTNGVGLLTDALRGGQPSFLTEATGSGSTVRIDGLRKGGGDAVYFHCRSGLVERFKELYPDVFRYEGKRAIAFGPKERVPVRALRHCLDLALTHHLRGK